VGGLRAGVCRLKEKNWHTMKKVFVMWPFLKDDLSNDKKLNIETEN
jgi:hypothetical protein